jgi:DNA (cytosine-5)-methyltransferase 1
MNQIKAVDLFCGVGGLTHGLQESGIDVVSGYDIDESCSWTYEKNNNALFVNKDIRGISAEDIDSDFGSARFRLLAGCAPCQPFSRYSLSAINRKDQKWSLLDEMSRLAETSSANMVTMENVPELAKTSLFSDFLHRLSGAGFGHIQYDVVNCSNYGVPQQRKRLILVASKFGPVLLPEPSIKKITVRQAFRNLKPLEAGETDSRDLLHSSARLSAVNLSRIKQSRPGGTWRDWDSSLVALCHKKKSGETYSSVYGRMQWDEPSPTITTQFYGYGNGRFGHPAQNRALSLREGAILQSFPRSYRFLRPKETALRKTIGRHIGNAVPVALARRIGSSLSEHTSNLA